MTVTEVDDLQIDDLGYFLEVVFDARCNMAAIAIGLSADGWAVEQSFGPAIEQT